MKVAIVGSRAWPNLGRVEGKVYLLNAQNTHLEIVSGGARGVDTAAINAAKELGLDYTVFNAEWDQYGRRAGFLRNENIVENADYIIAFWDGESKGTKHTIDLALKAKKHLEVIFP